MCRTFALLCCLTVCAPLLECQDENEENSFSPDQLDNLLAPVALYPDPLLAQLLVAATFPDEIDEAARFLRADPDAEGIDAQPWDVSVKAVAHYPEVLSWMADSLDWTTAAGQAYAAQPEDVMAAIQRLRAQARGVGNLESGPQQEVVDDSGNIEIWPAEPATVYVPVYDPDLVYFGSGGIGYVVTFGPALPIGAWLNRDFDWRYRKIYYHGWDHAPLWASRAQSHIKLSPVYVNSRYRQAATGRAAVSVNTNRAALNRYASIHRDLTFSRAQPGGAPPAESVPAANKIVQRNFDTGDPRIDAFRGVEPPAVRASEPERRPPAPAYQAPPQPAARQPQVVHAPAPESRPPAREAHEPERVSQPPRAAPEPPQPQLSHDEAFGGNRGPFDPQAASQRGQASRSEVSPPPAHQSAPHPPVPEIRDGGDKAHR